MGKRGKVVLQRIADDSKRRACLKKRKAGLLKKAHELSILCDVEVAAIIYSAEEEEPTIWPFPEKVNAIVDKFLHTPEAERNAKGVTQQRYIGEMVNKSKEKIWFLKKKSEEKDVENLFSMLCNGEIRKSDLTAAQLKLVKDFAERMCLMLKEHIEHLEGLPLPSDLRTHLPPPPPSCGTLRFMPVQGNSINKNSNGTIGRGAYGDHMIGPIGSSGAIYDK